MLTNTWKHATIGAAVGLIWFAVCAVRGMWQLEVWGIFAFFFSTLGWEYAQYLRRDKKKPWNRPDSIVDIIAGNIGFHILFWGLKWMGSVL